MNEIEDFRKGITDPSAFVNSDEQAIIKVVGVGGGGSNAVNYMFSQNIKNVDFVVCNTDRQALELSPVPTKLILGYELTGGLGAGNIPEVGRQCAEASADEIRKLFTPPTEMVFITAGMGGGTGTGAAPVVAQIAKDAGMLTIGIVTIPFIFEGEKKALKAHAGAKEMQKHVDALLVINNENLVELYPDFDFLRAFSKADDTLANAARSISEIISENCYINVDFHDVQTTLRDSGTAIISTAYGEGEHRITEAIHNALSSPLLKEHDINSSKRLLLKFSCNPEAERPLKMEEINEISQFTSQLPTIDVKWGVAHDTTLDDRVKITVLASGFDVTIREKGKQGEGVTLNDGKDRQTNLRFVDEPEAADETTEDVAILTELYGEKTMRNKKRDTARVKYAVLKPSQFDDEDIILRLERIPTAERNQKRNAEILEGSKAPAEHTPGTVSGQQSSASEPDGGDDTIFFG